MNKKIVALVTLLIGFNCVLGARGERALITGVSRGIGHALAKNLINRGIEVIGISRTDTSCLTDLISHPNFTYLSLDLTTEEGLFALQEFIQSKSYTFDLVVHNAGMVMPPQAIKDLSLKSIDQVMQINLLAPMKLSHILIPFCRAQGRILNITSRAATTVVPQIGPYCISKAGLDMLTLILREELREQKIAVAGVIPGEVDTKMQSVLRSTTTFDLKEKFEKNYLEGKLISPDVCAQFLSWLLCDVPWDTFNSQKTPWEIYDTSHHHKWLKGSLPPFPF